MNTNNIREGTLFLHSQHVGGSRGVVATARIINDHGDTLASTTLRDESNDKLNASVRALREIVPQIAPQIDVLRVAPDDRPMYISGKQCNCPICGIVQLDSALLGVRAECMTATRDDLPEFEKTRSINDERVSAERDSYRRTSIADKVIVRTRIVTDEQGKIVGRRVANPNASAEVWTDASVGGTTVGVAAVSNDFPALTEVFHKDTFRSSTRVLFGELAAIYLGISQAVRVANVITIYTDSQHAAERINESRCESFDPHVKTQLTKIKNLVESFAEIGGVVHVEWIKGHNGDSMNEAADRLANLARRSADWKMDDETMRRHVANIVEDVRENIA